MNAPSITPYTPPVDRLLSYGDARQFQLDADYLHLDLGPDHIPELIRMATDPRLNWADSDSLEIWAPIRAWQALGQLHAEAASEPLLSLFDELVANEWIIEEMPDVYGQIGPAAIPALAGYLAQAGHLFFSCVAAACLREIGRQQPVIRAECVSLIAQRLAQFVANDPTLNGCLISDLIDLKAVEAALLMARAFEESLSPLETDPYHPSVANDKREILKSKSTQLQGEARGLVQILKQAQAAAI